MDSAKEKLLLVLGAGAAFGSSVVLARYALREIDPYPLVVLRFGIAALAYVALILIWQKKMPRQVRLLFDMSVVGLFATGLPLLLFFFALAYVSSGMFTIFLATLPIATAVIANFFLKDEKLSKGLVIGLLISLFGITYLIMSKTNGLPEVFDIRGPLLVLGGVLMVAAGSVYARARLKEQDAFIVSSLQTVAAFILLLIIVALLGKFHIPDAGWLSWGAAVYNGLIGSFAAFWLTFILIKKYGATASELPTYVMPVVSMLLGVLLLGEVISLSLMVGAFIIFAGLVMAVKKHQVLDKNN